jgi:integration host factor subunit alpha
MNNGSTLTKAALVERVANHTGELRTAAKGYVEGLFHIIKGTLEAGESLKVSGFGTFVVRDKTSRRGRNPHTGETIVLDARRVVVFKASKLLRDRINKGE